MRSLSFAATFFCFTSTALFAAKEASNSALAAVRQLPRGENKRVVRIEARGGTPVPERWHIVVQDPKDENGVHEYVVAGGEVVASRAISQFVESAKPDDILKDSLVKIDSDKAATLALQFGQVNKVSISSLNYALKKEGVDAAPLWSVTCLDEAGKQVGVVVVSAGKGNVISHEGFTAEPGGEVIRAETQGETEAEREERRRNAKRVLVRTAQPVPATPTTQTTGEKKDVLSRVGNTLNKFFTGGNAKGKP